MLYTTLNPRLESLYVVVKDTKKKLFFSFFFRGSWRVESVIG